MNNNEICKKNVENIINEVISNINPYDRTRECISSFNFNSGRNILVSIGKASWIMAKAVCDAINIDAGVVITKYEHSKGMLDNIKIFEAGHPIVDNNSIEACKYALSITSNLNENDNVIVCLSGGGSSLFEMPLINLNELQDINDQLIKSGASINEINIIRKKLSSVKGGKFARHIQPAKIFGIVLSDVIGNDIGTIASGPISSDHSTSDDAINIINKYNVSTDCNIISIINNSNKVLVDNVEYRIIGSVEHLCEETKLSCERHGFKGIILNNNCCDDVNEIVEKFKQCLSLYNEHNVAYIIGGEASVTVKGNGKGGRNSHLALIMSKYLVEYDNAYFFTFASDGTDGPTDGAGGYVDCHTYKSMETEKYLENYDSYSYLSMNNGLIKTGPTGCNINDVYVLLIR